MRLLLDTNVLLWHLGGERDLGPITQKAIRDCDEVTVSTVAFAEIGIKVAVGKLEAPDDLLEQVLQTGVRLVPLDPEHGLRVARLPMHHRDPFDRLLIAQAMIEGLTLVTADGRFRAYGVPCLPALD